MNKVLLDQGLPYSTTHHLKNAGWEAVHVSEVGMSRATDHAVLSYARSNDYVCITLDADFHTILAIDNAKCPSVIRIRQEGLNGLALARLLFNIWPKIENPLQAGAMITVNENTLRIRRLPIVKD